jgi:hypothetical protein
MQRSYRSLDASKAIDVTCTRYPDWILENKIVAEKEHGVRMLI